MTTVELQQRIQRSINIDKESLCWNWLGATAQGYGQLRINGVRHYAHRVAYYAFIGDIPENMHVLHQCDNPSCVNPEHLFTGTHAANMRDKKEKGRVSRVYLQNETHGNSKLTNIEVNEIRDLYWVTKISQGQIAKWFGVSQSAISLIVNEKRRSISQ